MEKEIIENINRDFSDLTIIYVTHNPNIMPDNYKLIKLENLMTTNID